MLLAACASLRTAGQGCGAWSEGGVQTWRLVQQACVLRQAHTRQDAASLTGSQTATKDSDTASCRQEGSKTASTAKIGPEASSGNRLGHRQQQRTGRGLQQQRQAGVSSSGVAAAAAAGPEGAARPAALHPSDQGPILHKPYSHLVQGYYDFTNAKRIAIASALCTDIEALQFAHGSCPVQVSFVSHPADWDVTAYVQQHTVMQHQQQAQHWAGQALDSAAGNTTQFEGPFGAVLNHRTAPRVMHLTGLPLMRVLKSRKCDGAPHSVVLQERLCNVQGPSFLLHNVPASFGGNQLRPHSNYSNMISRAGEGPGLQVHPGSVSEVAPAGNITSNGSGRAAYTIPRVLICSQLPPDTTYPLDLTLTLMDCPGQQDDSGRQLGQWQVKAREAGRNTYIKFGKSHTV